MVLGKAEYPFIGYKLYKIYNSKENRQYAILVSENNTNDRIFLSYARYLMCVKEQRILRSDEQVDHIDDDKLNDDINNLQILSPLENQRKQAKKNGKQKVCLCCPYCGNLFFREKRQTHLCNNRGMFTACSRECAGKFSNLMRYNPSDPKVIIGLQNNVVMNYKLH